MKFILIGNVREHPAFPDFIRSAKKQYPIDSAFICTGSTLNVFPEWNGSLVGSVFGELNGHTLENEFCQLLKTGFKGAKAFVEPLNDMYFPVGSKYFDTKERCFARYQALLPEWEKALEGRQLLFVPGQHDLPSFSYVHTRRSPCVHQVDCEVIEIDGVKIGGIGGVSNNVHPLRGLCEIGPYEMTPSEFDRKLRSLWGVDVLITQASPDQSPELMQFIRKSPVKVVICTAPFNIAAGTNGKPSLSDFSGKSVFHVSTFTSPYVAYVVDLVRGKLTSLDIPVEFFSWRQGDTPLSPPSPPAAAIATHGWSATVHVMDGATHNEADDEPDDGPIENNANGNTRRKKKKRGGRGGTATTATTATATAANGGGVRLKDTNIRANITDSGSVPLSSPQSSSSSTARQQNIAWVQPRMSSHRRKSRRSKKTANALPSTEPPSQSAVAADAPHRNYRAYTENVKAAFQKWKQTYWTRKGLVNVIDKAAAAAAPEVLTGERPPLVQRMLARHRGKKRASV